MKTNTTKTTTTTTTTNDAHNIINAATITNTRSSSSSTKRRLRQSSSISPSHNTHHVPTTTTKTTTQTTSKAPQHLHHHQQQQHHQKKRYKEKDTKQKYYRTVVARVVFVIVASLLVCNYIIVTQVSSSSSSVVATTTSFHKSKLRKSWISTDSQPFDLHHHATEAHHLIMVAGHSVTISGHLEDANVDENDWFLLDYQKHKGLPEAIVKHIQAGIQECRNDPDSLLIFSGGETRTQTGPLSEGASYFQVADAMQLWEHPHDTTTTNNNNDDNDATTVTTKKKKETKSDPNNNNNNDVRSRTVTEEYATDSFQNLLFSICRFYEITGNYPTKITVVSFTFKQARFEEMHAKALRINPHNFHYIGVDPAPATTAFNLQEATQGERENAVLPYRDDPYGCHSPKLVAKRAARNPFKRTVPYALSCPALHSLLQYCGPDLIPPAHVPDTYLWRSFTPPQ